MVMRNITLSLDEEILREARVLAAQKGVSVSAFLRQELSRLVEDQRGYAKAREAALRRLGRGQSLGSRATSWSSFGEAARVSSASRSCRSSS
jgi:hypothetical protein